MIFLLIVFTIAVHNIWFFTNGILTHGDWWFMYSKTREEMLSFPYLWNNGSFGDVNLGITMYPINLLWGILSPYFDFATSERILYFFPAILLVIVSSYLLISKHITSQVGIIVGTIVYTFNTYFILGRSGHLTLMVAFGIAPLIVLFFQKSLEQKKIHYAILTGVFSTVMSIYEFRAFYILLWIIFFYYLYFQFVIEKNLSLLKLIKNSIIASIPVIIVVLSNSYWIIGFSQLGTLVTNEIFNRSLFGNELIDIRNALTLFHPLWTGSRPTEFIPQIIPMVFWVIPIMAFIGLLLQRKNKNILFFGFVALIGVLLTKQVSEPFSNLYLWLYNNFPGFNAYREASKFFFLIALGYSVLVAAFVDWMWNTWTSGRIKIFGKYILTILITGIFLWNTKPIITGEIGALFIPRTIPNDYKIIEKYIVSEKDYFRTLWVPTFSRWSPYSNSHPQVSAITQLNSSWKFLVLDDFNKGNMSEGELMIDMMQKPEVDNLLDNSSIKYVFIPLNDTQNDDDFFRFYGVDRAQYIQALDKLKYLKRVDIGTKEIMVYENEGYKPHMYITEEVETIAEEIEYKQVNYKYENSTKYSITLEDIKHPVYLNFAESYHPQWKVRIGEFSWLKALTQSEYFLSPDIQTISDAHLNSYRIDPKQICAKFECTQKNDGSYDINVTLFFLPQSYTYLGGIISLSTLVLIVGYLVFTFSGKKK